MEQCGDPTIFLTAGDQSGHCGGGGRVFTSPLVVFQLLSRDPGHNVDSLAVYLACVREQLYNGDLLRCSMMLMSSRQFFYDPFFGWNESQGGGSDRNTATRTQSEAVAKLLVLRLSTPL